MFRASSCYLEGFVEVEHHLAVAGLVCQAHVLTLFVAKITRPGFRVVNLRSDKHGEHKLYLIPLIAFPSVTPFFFFIIALRESKSNQPQLCHTPVLFVNSNYSLSTGRGEHLFFWRGALTFCSCVLFTSMSSHTPRTRHIRATK